MHCIFRSAHVNIYQSDQIFCAIPYIDNIYRMACNMQKTFPVRIRCEKDEKIYSQSFLATNQKKKKFQTTSEIIYLKQRFETECF